MLEIVYLAFTCILSDAEQGAITQVSKKPSAIIDVLPYSLMSLNTW